MKSYSNNFIIGGELVKAPDILSVSNFKEDSEIIFVHRKRKKELRNIIIHETAGQSAISAKHTLKRKKLGVHLILDRNGHISNHVDLLNDITFHAHHVNSYSIGIEIVNPYSPKSAKGMKYNTMPAKWWTWLQDQKDPRYVLPTDQQLSALINLIPFLALTLNIPYDFPTKNLNAKNPKVKRKLPTMKRIPKPGIVAHRDFDKHADGRYPLEYLIKNSTIYDFSE